MKSNYTALNTEFAKPITSPFIDANGEKTYSVNMASFHPVMAACVGPLGGWIGFVNDIAIEVLLPIWEAMGGDAATQFRVEWANEVKAEFETLAEQYAGTQKIVNGSLFDNWAKSLRMGTERKNLPALQAIFRAAAERVAASHAAKSQAAETETLIDGTVVNVAGITERYSVTANRIGCWEAEDFALFTNSLSDALECVKPLESEGRTCRVWDEQEQEHAYKTPVVYIEEADEEEDEEDEE